MALMKDGDPVPLEGDKAWAKFLTTCDKALAITFLTMDLLYLVGNNPTDPVPVWRVLRKFSLRLSEGRTTSGYARLYVMNCQLLVNM